MIWLFLVLALFIVALALLPELATKLLLVAAWGLMALGVAWSIVKALLR